MTHEKQYLNSVHVRNEIRIDRTQHYYWPTLCASDVVPGSVLEEPTLKRKMDEGRGVKKSLFTEENFR
jgi:hypothetical protein